MPVISEWKNEKAITAIRAIRAAAVNRKKGDYYRKSLCGVYLTDGIALASDAYTMVTIPIPYKGQDLVLPSKIVERIVSINLSDIKFVSSFTISKDKQFIYVDWIIGTTKYSSVEVQETEPFPNWKFVLPADDQYKISSPSPELNIDLFFRIAKIVRELGDVKKSTVKLVHMPSPEEATVWSINVPSFGSCTWVQMPVVTKR